MVAIILALLVLTPVALVTGDLAKRCKQITCAKFEYCSVHESICRPCEQACTKESDLYEKETCDDYCQDYIHEKTNNYVRLTDLPDILRPIYWMFAVILLLLIVIVVLNGGMVVRKWHRHYARKRLRRLEDQKFQKKLSPPYAIGNNNNSTSADESVRMATILQMGDASCTNTNRSTSVPGTLPLSTEEPSEDCTLDYGAYMNKALSQSPSNEVSLNTRSRY